jgi:hypothetical protein
MMRVWCRALRLRFRGTDHSISPLWAVCKDERVAMRKTLAAARYSRSVPEYLSNILRRIRQLETAYPRAQPFFLSTLGV